MPAPPHDACPCGLGPGFSACCGRYIGTGTPAPDADLLVMLSQFVVLESTIAVVVIGFGTLMLTNEFITTALRRLAETDPLTQVFNRRSFLTLLDKAMSSAQRTGAPLPVLVLDLKNVIYIDSSGADALMSLIETCRKNAIHLIVCGLSHQPLDIAQRSGLMAHLKEHLQPDLSSSLALAVSLSAEPAR